MTKKKHPKLPNGFGSIKKLSGNRIASEAKTFAEVYAEYFTYKYERDKTREYSKSSVGATKAAYNQAKALHDKPFSTLRTEDLQEVIDNCQKNMRTM